MSRKARGSYCKYLRASLLLNLNCEWCKFGVYWSIRSILTSNWTNARTRYWSRLFAIRLSNHTMRKSSLSFHLFLHCVYTRRSKIQRSYFQLHHRPHHRSVVTVRRIHRNKTWWRSINVVRWFNIDNTVAKWDRVQCGK